MRKPTRKAKPTRLRPVHPSAAIRAEYQRRLDKLIEEMNHSVTYWVKAAYRNNTPAIAELAMDDILPTNVLKRVIAKLKKKWLKAFDKAAPLLADYFAKASHLRSDAALAKILRDGGFSVKWQMTQAMKDVVQATTAENVGLIKSIPSKYLDKVEGMVMRSVATGRDMGTLAKGLQQEFKVTKGRAALIARDQNNKASANMTRARYLEVGVTKATWRHSAAGKKPRPTHVKNNGKTYDVKKGWWDPAVKEYIHPGQLINCRCVSIPIIAGFS